MRSPVATFVSRNRRRCSGVPDRGNRETFCHDRGVDSRALSEVWRGLPRSTRANATRSFVWLFGSRPRRWFANPL